MDGVPQLRDWPGEFVSYQVMLSKNLKQYRLLKHLSQEQLGLLASVDRTLVSKIERCIANPSLEILTRLSICLHVSISDLVKK